MTARLGFIAQLPGQDRQGAALIPTEFQIFPEGQVEIKGEQPFVVDDTAMNQVITQFQGRGLDMVIDYEHQTEGGEYSSPDGKAPAAGWIKSLENRGADGLWAKVAWTEAAMEFLRKREYRYFSPVFMVSKNGRKLVELLRVALTNAPRLNWIRPIVAKNNSHQEGDRMESLKLIAKQLELPETATIEEVTARLGRLRQGHEFFLASTKEAGLPETATGEQVIAAIKALKQPVQVVACKEALGALGLKHDASRSEVVASIHALRQRPDATVLQEIASLKARLAERDKDDLVTAALKEGKITPAQREWAEKYALDDPEGFRLFLAKAPQVVPVDGGRKAGDPPVAGLDDSQLHINKLMGVDPETFKKHNPTA